MQRNRETSVVCIFLMHCFFHSPDEDGWSCPQGHFRSVLFNCLYSENQLNWGGHAGNVRRSSSTTSKMLAQCPGRVYLLGHVCGVGLVGDLIVYGPQCSLNHISGNTTVDKKPACLVEQMSTWANIHTSFSVTNRIFKLVFRALQMYEPWERMKEGVRELKKSHLAWGEGLLKSISIYCFCHSLSNGKPDWKRLTHPSDQRQCHAWQVLV